MTAKLPLLDWTKIAEWRDVIIDAAIEHFAPHRDPSWLSNPPDPRHCIAMLISLRHRRQSFGQ
jgi:hypothetical protein